MYRDNIRKHPEIFQKVIAKGHSIGNHTYNHLNGWKNPTQNYVRNFEECNKIIEEYGNPTKLFRPPYGKIKPSQAKIIRRSGYTIVMWDIISYDFDVNTTPEECFQNVVKNTQNGSIIVFHDSIKAWPNLQLVLPKVIQELKKQGVEFGKLNY
nr:polysaccharide deacetylase family protein [Flavobacterium sediminis]